MSHALCLPHGEPMTSHTHPCTPSVLPSSPEQAARLGITTVVSTDSIRHMLRSFQPPQEAPLLWASTYEAGEALPPATREVGYQPRGAR